MIDGIRRSHDPLVITQNGANTAVLVDHDSYQRTRQALALLKLVARGESDVAKGRVISQDQVFRSLKQRLKAKIHASAKKRTTG